LPEGANADKGRRRPAALTANGMQPGAGSVVQSDDEAPAAAENVQPPLLPLGGGGDGAIVATGKPFNPHGWIASPASQRTSEANSNADNYSGSHHDAENALPKRTEGRPILGHTLRSHIGAATAESDDNSTSFG